MPKFDLRVIENWEHMVYYRQIEAETIEEAFQAVREKDWSPSDNEVIEDGDVVIRCWEATCDGVEIKLPPEMEKEPLGTDLPPRELATVLAALRALQGQLQPPYLCGDWDDVSRAEHLKRRFEHFDDVEPLTIAEIDALCERLNVTVASYD